MRSRRSGAYHEVPDVSEMDPWKDDRCRDFVALNTIQRLRAYHLAPDVLMPPVEPVHAVRAKNLLLLPRAAPDYRPCMGESSSSVREGPSMVGRLSSASLTEDSTVRAGLHNEKPEKEPSVNPKDVSIKNGMKRTKREREDEEYKKEGGEEEEEKGSTHLLRTPPRKSFSTPLPCSTPISPSSSLLSPFISTGDTRPPSSTAVFPFECAINLARQIFFGPNAFTATSSRSSLVAGAAAAMTLPSPFPTPVSRPTSSTALPTTPLMPLAFPVPPPHAVGDTFIPSQEDHSGPGSLSVGVVATSTSGALERKEERSTEVGEYLEDKEKVLEYPVCPAFPFTGLTLEENGSGWVKEAKDKSQEVLSSSHTPTSAHGAVMDHEPCHSTPLPQQAERLLPGMHRNVVGSPYPPSHPFVGDSPRLSLSLVCEGSFSFGGKKEEEEEADEREDDTEQEAMRGRMTILLSPDKREGEMKASTDKEEEEKGAFKSKEATPETTSEGEERRPCVNLIASPYSPTTARATPAAVGLTSSDVVAQRHSKEEEETSMEAVLSSEKCLQADPKVEQQRMAEGASLAVKNEKVGQDEERGVNLTVDATSSVAILTAYPRGVDSTIPFGMKEASRAFSVYQSVPVEVPTTIPPSSKVLPYDHLSDTVKPPSFAPPSSPSCSFTPLSKTHTLETVPHTGRPAECEVVEALVAHYQSLLTRGVVLDRFNNKELAFAWWVIGNNMDRDALDHPKTGRREALLITFRNFYYSQLSSKRRTSTGVGMDRSTSGEETAGVDTGDGMEATPVSLADDDEEDARPSRRSGRATPSDGRRSTRHTEVSLGVGNEGKGVKRSDSASLFFTSSSVVPRHSRQDPSVIVEGHTASRMVVSRDRLLSSTTAETKEEQEKGPVREEEKEAKEEDAIPKKRGGQEMVSLRPDGVHDGTRDRRLRKGRRLRPRDEEEDEEVEERIETHLDGYFTSSSCGLSSSWKEVEVSHERGEAPGREADEDVTTRTPQKEQTAVHSTKRAALPFTHKKEERKEEEANKSIATEEERKGRSGGILQPKEITEKSETERHHQLEDGVEERSVSPASTSSSATHTRKRMTREEKRRAIDALWVPSSSRSNRYVRSQERAQAFEAILVAVSDERSPSSATLGVATSAAVSTPHSITQGGVRTATIETREENEKENTIETSKQPDIGQNVGGSRRLAKPPSTKNKESKEEEQDGMSERKGDHAHGTREVCSPTGDTKETTKKLGLAYQHIELGRKTEEMAASCADVLPQTALTLSQKNRKKLTMSKVVEETGYRKRPPPVDEGLVRPKKVVKYEIHTEEAKTKRKKDEIEKNTTQKKEDDEEETKRRGGEHRKKTTAAVTAALTPAMTAMKGREGGVGDAETSQDDRGVPPSSTREDMGGKKGRGKQPHSGASVPTLSEFLSFTEVATASPLDASVSGSVPSSPSPLGSHAFLPLLPFQHRIQERLRFRLLGGGGGVRVTSSLEAPTTLASSSSDGEAHAFSSAIPPSSLLASPPLRAYLQEGGYPSFRLVNSYRFLLLSSHHLLGTVPVDRTWGTTSQKRSQGDPTPPTTAMPGIEEEEEREGGREWVSSSPIPSYYRDHVPPLRRVDPAVEAAHGGIDPVLVASSFWRHDQTPWAQYIHRTLKDFSEKQKIQKVDASQEEACEGTDSAPHESPTLLSPPPSEKEVRVVHLQQGSFFDAVPEPPVQNVKEGPSEEGFPARKNESTDLCAGHTIATMEREKEEEDWQEEGRFAQPSENDGREGKEDKAADEEDGERNAEAPSPSFSAVPTPDSSPLSLPVPSSSPTTSASSVSLPCDMHYLSYAQQCLLVWEASSLLQNLASASNDGREQRGKDSQPIEKKGERPGAPLRHNRSFSPQTSGAIIIDYWSEYR